MKDRDTMHNCYDFIKVRRERRHFRTLERQLSKFYRLCQKNTTGCSSPEHGRHGCTWSQNNQYTIRTHNIDVETNRDSMEQEKEETSGENRVRNISKTPLTQAQEKL